MDDNTTEMRVTEEDRGWIEALRTHNSRNRARANRLARVAANLSGEFADAIDPDGPEVMVSDASSVIQFSIFVREDWDA